jgi:hypothetical protein
MESDVYPPDTAKRPLPLRVFNMNKWGNITIGVLDQGQPALAQPFCGGFSPAFGP